MIRINLAPGKQQRGGRRTTRTRAVPEGKASRGPTIFLLMLIGWAAIGGGLYWANTSVAEAAAEARGRAAKDEKQIKELRELIDEERLAAITQRTEQLRTAREKLEAQKRSPVWVMNEITNILTTGEKPEIDPEAMKRQELVDPKAKLDDNWDANAVWIEGVNEAGEGIVELVGGARDASDLHEFVKRMRASQRFQNVSHPEWKTEVPKASKEDDPVGTFVTFKLTASVRYWD